jgi:general secretion pathway protein H
MGGFTCRGIKNPKGGYQKGFTLIEVIIVLIIIAVASALVGVLVNKGSESVEIRTFSKDISATLRYARNHAVSEKKTYCFVIDKDESMYKLYAVSSEDEEDVELVISKPIPEEIEVVTDNSEEVFFIEFFPRGDSSGGMMEVIHNKGMSFLISVNRITGKVEVEKGE